MIGGMVLIKTVASGYEYGIRESDSRNWLSVVFELAWQDWTAMS